MSQEGTHCKIELWGTLRPRRDLSCLNRCFSKNLLVRICACTAHVQIMLCLSLTFGLEYFAALEASAMRSLQKVSRHAIMAGSRHGTHWQLPRPAAVPRAEQSLPLAS